MLLNVTENTVIVREKMLPPKRGYIHACTQMKYWIIIPRVPGGDQTVNQTKFGQFLWWLPVHKSGGIKDQQGGMSRLKMCTPGIKKNLRSLSQRCPASTKFCNSTVTIAIASA